MKYSSEQKTVVVGAGPVGALAAIYAARRGDDVEVYELRDGELSFINNCIPIPKLFLHGLYTSGSLAATTQLVSLGDIGDIRLCQRKEVLCLFYKFPVLEPVIISMGDFPFNWAYLHDSYMNLNLTLSRSSSWVNYASQFHKVNQSSSPRKGASIQYVMLVDQVFSERVLNETIPMHGRMIHGRDSHGRLTEQPQEYDVHGRVCYLVPS